MSIRANDGDGELEGLYKFLYMAPVGIVQSTIDGEILLINPMAANLLMPLQADASLSNIFAALDGSIHELKKMVDEHRANSGRICNALRFSPLHRARRYAVPKTYELTLIKIDAMTLMSILTDVSEAVNREEEIRLGSAWYSALLRERFAHGAVTLDHVGVVQSWNHAMEKLTGFAPPAIIGASMERLFSSQQYFSQQLSDMLFEAAESGWTVQNGWCNKKNGETFWANYIIFCTTETASTQETLSGALPTPSYQLVVRDFDAHIDAASKMMRAAKIDHLTGVLNRATFFDLGEIEIKRWFRTPRSLSLLAIDADFFKSINDTYGHDTGDAALQALAASITATVRETDITARIGGEEFVVLLPHTGMTDAIALAERIRKNVATIKVNRNGNTFGMSVSIGVAEMTAHLPSLVELMKVADQALYGAKKDGRNRVHWVRTGV